jgi:signal transduction histidine kinase
MATGSNLPKDSKPLREGSAVFRPRARIIQTIGRDLISNEFIAIQELIKNAYDADATKVTLTFEEPLQRGQGAVIVEDNGTGMTLSVLRDSWMEPATVTKVTKTVTPRGRRVTGEKGIGRFAAARVARSLYVQTRPENSNEEVHVVFDWGAFEDQSRYLDEISCLWQVYHRPASFGSGTLLRLEGLNDEWAEDDERDLHSFSQLRAELSRLVAPLERDEFEIQMNLPMRFNQFAGIITPPPVLGHPKYNIIGKMDRDGFLDAVLEGPDGQVQIQEANGARSQVLLSTGKKPRCGPFSFDFKIWDREDLGPLADELGSTIRDIRRDLNAAGGISIYRDHFRLLLPQTDWLRLDLRRVQNPTLRVSNNQIVGKVFISADQNRGLKDQTNRQGIVDTPEFWDFKGTLLDIISRLEARRDSHRRAHRTEKIGAGLFESLRLTPLKGFLLNRYPKDPELKQFLENQEKVVDDSIGEVQRVLSRYRRLATLGQLIDVVLHEGREPVSTISNQIELIKLEFTGVNESSEGKFFKRAEVIERQLQVLKLLFERLSPFSGRKRGKPRPVTLEAVIANAFGLMDKQLKHLNIAFSAPLTGKTTIIADEAELETMIVNLLNNAMYWLQKIPDKRQISVELKSDEVFVAIYFSDSGLGVQQDIREKIFDPYFTTRPDGIGLGLTIVGETAAEYGGSLELLESGKLPGACFKIKLKRATIS